MGYGLGVDLGTTHTAAAVDVDGHVEAVRLGSHRPEIPSLVYLRADGEVLVGEAAQRRGEGDPTRLAREFKRRLGDPVPIMLGGAPFSAHALTARLLSYVVEAVTRTQEAAPARIVVTHPANWGPYKRELLMQAVQLADLATVTLRPEPQAAAVRFAGTARVAVGETVAVYDLGGGTFDAAVLRKSATGFVLLGEPSGIEQLGGIDFDEAILDRVRAALGDDVLAGLDPDDDKVTEALARLRRDCVEAKESLSYDTEAVIAVALPRLHTRVRINRADFEAMIAPAIDDTVAAVHRALRSAGVRPDELRCIVLAGGSARIPLVGEKLSAAFDRPVVLDEQPELGIALGAAMLSAPGPVPAPAPAPAPAGRLPSVARSADPDVAVVAGKPAPGPVAAAAVPAAGPSSAPRPGSAIGRAAAPVSPVRSPHGDSDGADRHNGNGNGPGRTAGGRRRWRTYRWPLVGGVVAVILAVTAAAAWPRTGNSPVAASPSTDPPAASSLVWQVATGHPATGSPAVAAGRVVVGGSDGVIRAFNRADGHLDWSLPTGGKQVTVAAQVRNNIVYATTADGVILAVDAGTGAQQWRKPTGTELDARPVVAGERIYAGGRDAVLYAYELGGDHRRWRVWTGAAIHSSPALAGDITTAASRDGRLYGADRTGRLVWKTTVGQVTGDLTAAGDAACFALDDGSVRCAAATDGTLLKRMTLPGTELSSPIGGDGVVYAAAADRTVAAWDTRTGALRWRYRPTGGAPAAGFLALRDGELTVTYPDGRLAGIDAGTGAERWTVAVDDHLDTVAAGAESSMFAVGTTGILHDLRVPAAPAASPATRPQSSSASPTPTPTPSTRAPRTHATTPPSYRPKTSRPRTTEPTSPTPPSVPPTTTDPTPPAGALPT